MNVYIVDDSTLDAQIAEDVIREYDPEIEVEIQTSSEKAAKEILYKDVDLIILDLNMPRLDGVQFLEHLISRGINIPVVIYSSHVHDYIKRIDKSKVLKVLSKSDLHNSEKRAIADIFLSLNIEKSCVLLSTEFQKMVVNKKKKLSDFVDHLQKIKDSLRKFSE